MLEDFRLKVFVAVAREKSFTKAAAQLSITQPAVSQHISELEKHLGVKLFERLRGETLLTEAGQYFIEYALRVIRTYDEIDQVFKRFPNKVVKVSASDEVYNHLVTNLLGRFLLIHPEIAFQNSFMQDVDLEVKLIPSDGDNAQLVFETINSTGVSLNETDKIRNYVIFLFCL